MSLIPATQTAQIEEPDKLWLAFCRKPNVLVTLCLSLMKEERVMALLVGFANAECPSVKQIGDVPKAREKMYNFFGVGLISIDIIKCFNQEGRMPSVNRLLGAMKT